MNVSKQNATDGLLIGDCVGFDPFRKVLGDDEDVSVTAVLNWIWATDVHRYEFERP